MRFAYVQPFVQSAREILEQLLSEETSTGKIELCAAPVPCSGVTAIVGLTGEGEGRVLYYMSTRTALEIASRLNDDELQEELSGLAKDTLSELASMITGRAISVLNDKGHQLRVSPPTLIAGENVTISNMELETMVVPVETTLGTVIVNVAMATR